MMTKPSPIALVVCDAIYREPAGKTALVGLFNRIRARSVPVEHAQLSIYAAVTDVRPGTAFRIRIEHGETGHVVTELKGPVPDNVGPTAICDFMFNLTRLRFPHAGRYYIQFWGNEHILLQRPFEVERTQRSEETDASDS